MKLVVLGADSWIGSRFAKCAGSLPSLDVVGWAMEKSAGPDYRGAHVYGMENIASAISGADIVVNLHESQDFSLMPDEKALHHHNVEFVESLISTRQQPGQNWKLIHLSTPLLQCSSRWPNINGSETRPDEVPSSRPFKAYCASKQRAEELLQCSTIDCIVVRPVNVYGQGDDCSVITDILKMSSKFGFAPEIGDRDGVTQLMALDNLMLGLWNCVEKLYPDDFECNESSQSLHCEHSYEDRDLGERVFETVLLCDDTEKRPFFDNFCECIPGGKINIPLLPLYYIYYFVAMIICLFGPNIAKRMPDPDYFYMNFHHWTFFNNFKAKQYLGYKPLPSQNELQTSRDYYRSLLPSNIARYSWQITRPPLH